MPGPGRVHLGPLMRPAEVLSAEPAPGRASSGRHQPQAVRGRSTRVGACPSEAVCCPAPQSGRPSLKLLAERVLGIRVQQAEHCSVSACWVTALGGGGAVPALAPGGGLERVEP